MARRGTGIISVLISGDASPLKKEVDSATSALDSFGSKLSSGFATLAKAGATAAVAAGAAFAAYAKGGIEAAIATEAAQERLATLLRNTGLATEDQIAGLNKQAASLEKIGVAAGSNITVLQSQLATFDLSAEAIEKLTPAIVDYVIAEKGAAATADDFQGAANGLAQALQGNFGALSRVGFVLDDTTKDMIANGTEAERAAALVDVLSSTYGGFNEKARETAAGGLQALKNEFGAVQEQVGAALLPSLLTVTSTLADALLPAFQSFGDWFTENKEEIQAFITNVLERIITTVTDVITAFRDWYRDHGPAVLESFQKLKDPIEAIWEDLGNIVRDIGELFGKFQDGNPDADIFAAILQWMADTAGDVLVFISLIADEVAHMTKKMNEFADSDGFKAFKEAVRLAKELGITDVLKNLVPGAATLGNLQDILAQRAAQREVEAAIPGQRGGYRGTYQPNVTVNVMSADPNAVVDALRRYTRSNGPLSDAIR